MKLTNRPKNSRRVQATLLRRIIAAIRIRSTEIDFLSMSQMRFKRRHPKRVPVLHVTYPAANRCETPASLRTVDEIELLQEPGIVKRDMLCQLRLPCPRIRLDETTRPVLPGCQTHNCAHNYTVAPIMASCRDTLATSRLWRRVLEGRGSSKELRQPPC